MKIAKGDSVVVITGKDKGKTGAVLRVLKNKNKVVVAGINMRTKHVKKTPQKAGEKITYEGSIAVSNVMLVDPKTSKRSRVGYKVDSKGKKVRFAKKSGEALKAVSGQRSAVSKDAKTTKETAEKKAKTVKKEDDSKPNKQPFWKRKKDAAEGADDGDVQGGRGDEGVVDQATASGRRSNQRGS